jgi:hypothetical protein
VGEQDGILNLFLNVVCFLPGTLITTPTGERLIETLQPGDLIPTTLVHWRPHQEPIRFLNIELERHALIRAQSLLVESFIDNQTRSGWDNYAAYLALYAAEMPLARINFSRQLPSRVERQLRPSALQG